MLICIKEFISEKRLLVKCSKNKESYHNEFFLQIFVIQSISWLQTYELCKDLNQLYDKEKKRVSAALLNLVSLVGRHETASSNDKVFLSDRQIKLFNNFTTFVLFSVQDQALTNFQNKWAQLSKTSLCTFITLFIHFENMN